MRWRWSARDVVLVLLTLGSGSVDALCFLGLGQVLTSVMTGNLVLLGLAAGHGEGLAVLRSAIAVAGYVVASFAATRWLPEPAKDTLWTSSATATLTGEVGLLAAASVTWLSWGGHPTGITLYLLILVYAFAMGTQSATIHSLGIPGMSTTYMTGTLTWIAASLAHRSVEPEHIARRLAIVASVLIGAACSSLLLLFAPLFAPLFPLVAIGLGLGTAALNLQAGQ